MKRFNIQYFGTISSFQMLCKESQIIIDPNEPYRKMCFTNRTVITTSQGLLSLTIPIQGGRNQHQPLAAIQIANDSPWQLQHLKSIENNYKRSPFFEYYFESVKPILLTKETNLLNYLLNVQDWVKKQLKGDWTFRLVNESDIDLPILSDYKPNNYHMHDNNIQYTQVYDAIIGFQPNVSILDLLFCVGGKTAKKLLAD